MQTFYRLHARTQGMYMYSMVGNYTYSGHAQLQSAEPVFAYATV